MSSRRRNDQAGAAGARGNGMALLAGLAVAACIALAFAGPARAHHPADADGKPNPCGRPGEPPCPKALAFLVNGFGGCCVSQYVLTELGRLGATVHVSNWNDIRRYDPTTGMYSTIEPNGHPGCFSLTNPFGCSPSPRPYSDEAFIGQMQAAIAAVGDPETKIVLIGHSFGADSLLQVVQRIGGRRIAFLGLLDPVGAGGLRVNVTSWAQAPTPNPVPSNVDVVFNRWQRLTPFPLENLGWYLPIVGTLPLPPPQGRVSSQAGENDQGEQSFRKDAHCQTKYSLLIFPRILPHEDVPNDQCVRRKLVNALRAKVFNPYPRVVAAGRLGPSPLLLDGVRLTFSTPIDPTTFTVEDVVVAPSAVTGVEVVTGSGNRSFIVRFQQVSVLFQGRLTVGPNILDVDDLDPADHRPMDQNANLVPGETTDRYSIDLAPEGPRLPIEPPAVLGLKAIVGLQQRVRRIVAIEVTFDRALARAVATDIAYFRLIIAGRDGRFGTADDRRVPVASATYEASRRRVTLVPGSALAADQPVQVLVIDGPGVAPFAGVVRRP